MSGSPENSPEGIDPSVLPNPTEMDEAGAPPMPGSRLAGSQGSLVGMKSDRSLLAVPKAPGPSGSPPGAQAAMLSAALGAATAPNPPLDKPPIPTPPADAAVCPFAAIAAAIDAYQESGGGQPVPTVSANSKHEAHRGVSKPTAKKEKKKQEPADFEPHTFEKGIPEGSALKQSVLQEGLEEALPSRTGGMGITCPMTGAKQTLEFGMVKKGEEDDELDARSAKSGSSHSKSRGGSRKAASSKHSSKGGSSKNKSSKNSSSKGTSRRRKKRAIRFSAFEADTYVPQIKQSWGLMLKSNTLAEIGTKFCDNFLKELGAEIDTAAMFTSPKEIFGSKMGEVINYIVTMIDTPQSLHEKLKALGPLHVERGVKEEQLPHFGRALLQTITEVMDGKFTLEQRGAWDWLWTWLSQVFSLSLEEASTEATILTRSWDIAMDNCPGTEFGELLFDTLAEIAPTLVIVFDKAKPVLSVKFLEMISALVSYSGDAARMEEQITFIGIRHVNYGAKPHHTKVMGQVVIATMEKAVGEEWTVDMHNAWTELWFSTCEVLMKVTMAAEVHGPVIQQLWKDVMSRTTKIQFGSTLRKMLLLGTEWVQGLSTKYQAHVVQEEEDENEKKQREKKEHEQKANKARRMSVEDSKAQNDQDDEAEEEKDKGGTFSDKSKDADAIGTLFCELMGDLTEVLWSPELMNEKLIVQTNFFYELGIQTAHLQTVGGAICNTMERLMEGAWEPKHKEAWDWFWTMTEKDMKKALDILELGDAQILQQSWQTCKDSMNAEDLGNIFFKELARIAPHVTTLFNRPKNVQAQQFINIINMIVSFTVNPQLFYEELKPLTIKHMKHGVKADYARPFGRAILFGVKQTLGEKFDERTERVWNTLWVRVSSAVTRSLNVGSSLGITALVQEDIDKMKAAMDCIPRGMRAESLTAVDVNGVIISPLYFSVQSGQKEIPEFIINDLLTIRADRNMYYYGRTVLFQKHPDVVEVLCRETPHLLDLLLDGLMWHANVVTNGKVRVNYYIRELYGVPDEVPNVWTSGLGVLVIEGQPEVFNHPVIEKLLELKWQKFGLKMYSAMQFYYTLIFILFNVAFVQNAYSCDPTFVWMRTGLGIMSAMTFAVMSVVVGSQAYRNQTAETTLCGVKLYMPRFLMNAWNMFRYLTTILLLAVSFSEKCNGKGELTGSWIDEEGLFHITVDWDVILTALSTIVIWMQQIQLLILSTAMEAFTYAVSKMVSEFLRNVALVLLTIFAFSGALLVMRSPGFEDGLLDSVLAVVKILIGLGNDEGQTTDSAGVACLIAVIVIVNIILLNILISQYVLAYEKISEDQAGFAKMNRAYITVEMESFLSLNYRNKIFDLLGFDVPLELDENDHGPGGGVQVFQDCAVRSHPKYVPDRVIRFPGDASPTDPWPSDILTASEQVANDDEEE